MLPTPPYSEVSGAGCLVPGSTAAAADGYDAEVMAFIGVSKKGFRVKGFRV